MCSTNSCCFLSLFHLLLLATEMAEAVVVRYDLGALVQQFITPTTAATAALPHMDV